MVQPPKKKKKKDRPTPSPFAVVVKANGFSSNPFIFIETFQITGKRKWFQQMYTRGIRTDLGGNWSLCLCDVGSFDEGFRVQRWGDGNRRSPSSKGICCVFHSTLNYSVAI